MQSKLRTTEWAWSSSCSSLGSVTAVLSPSWSSPTSELEQPSASLHGQINREKQKDKTGEKENPGVFWSDDTAGFLGYDVGVVSVGTGDSPAFVGGAASVGGVGPTAAASLGVTVTEAVGAALDMGRSGGMP